MTDLKVCDECKQKLLVAYTSSCRTQTKANPSKKPTRFTKDSSCYSIKSYEDSPCTNL